jgi:hypothetical protein
MRRIKYPGARRESFSMLLMSESDGVSQPELFVCAYWRHKFKLLIIGLQLVAVICSRVELYA